MLSMTQEYWLNTRVIHSDQYLINLGLGRAEIGQRPVFPYARLAKLFIVFGESVLRSSIENDFRRYKQDKVVRVLRVCIIEDVSWHTVLTRWMIEKLSFDTVLFWLIGGAAAKNPVKNLTVRTEAVWSTDRSILGRQVCSYHGIILLTVILYWIF